MTPACQRLVIEAAATCLLAEARWQTDSSSACHRFLPQLSPALCLACRRGAHRAPGHARSFSDNPVSFTYGQLGALPMYTAIRAKGTEDVRQQQQQQPKTPKVLGTRACQGAGWCNHFDEAALLASPNS